MTVILERPRIGPVKDEIRANVARLLGVEAGCVNVKGKSHERVDAVGEGRAIEEDGIGGEVEGAAVLLHPRDLLCVRLGQLLPQLVPQAGPPTTP